MMTLYPPANMPMVARRGLMLVLSSPSGAGKTTISRMVLAKDKDVVPSVSYTTRPPRASEVDGTDYHFIEIQQFKDMVREGLFLEHAKVYDNYYGTLRGPVEVQLRRGSDVLFDIDWQGTQQIAQNAHADLVSVFILPPSVTELERRLRVRASDSSDVVAARMSKASAEISHWREYDYIIINSDLERSAQAVLSILASERLKRDRQQGMVDFVNDLRRDHEVGP